MRNIQGVKNQDDTIEDQQEKIDEQAQKILDLEEDNKNMKILIDNLMEMTNAMNQKVLQIQDIQLKDKLNARKR